MSQILLDYLLVIIAIAVSWSYRPHPPPEDDGIVGNAALQTSSQGPAAAKAGSYPAGSAPAPLARVLGRICLASGYPGIDTFLDGARESYEIIVQAFASGELEPHAYLLSESVGQTFAAAIRARQARGESCELTFICFQEVDIADAVLDNDTAQISVRFRSHVVSATRDSLGKVLAGDPLRVVQVAELWTFERELRSRARHWVLVATETID
jgi:predicted lipid-binding transport protein (Tim44 family)